jgi:hypothetical protein
VPKGPPAPPPDAPVLPDALVLPDELVLPDALVLPALLPLSWSASEPPQETMDSIAIKVPSAVKLRVIRAPPGWPVAAQAMVSPSL